MNAERILVRAPNWIGDQVLAYYFFVALRRLKPDGKITVACNQLVADLQFQTLVDQVVVLDQPSSPKFLDRFRALETSAEKLRKLGPFDLAISLPNSLSSAWLLFRSGAKRRVGYDGDGRSFLLTERSLWKRHGAATHRAEAYLNLLLPLGFSNQRLFQIDDIRDFWGVRAENDLDPDIKGVQSHFDFMNEWSPASIIERPAQKYWVLAPGATADSRRWSVAHWVALANRIDREWGFVGVIVGGPKEAVLGEKISKQSSAKLFNRAGDGRVPDFSQLFKGAEFAVTNESGLAHVAAFCGTDTQIVCGAADPRRTRPVGPGLVQVSINPIACWPCERNECLFKEPARKNQCHEGQSSDQIFEEITRLRQKKRDS